jgi:hypothetical protein
MWGWHMLRNEGRFQVSGVRCQKKDDRSRTLIILEVIKFVILTPDT